MKVISLSGTDDRLYGLVARLVMNPYVLRKNNNYPFKTDSQYTWHICMTDNDNVIGFMPVKRTGHGLSIDNYYINGDAPEILGSLISHIISTTDIRPITALSHKRHTESFHKYGFIISTIFAQYNRMQYTLPKGDIG